MKIKKLFLNTDKIIKKEKLILEKNGIIGNKYIGEFSPRQVLITGMKVYKKFSLPYYSLKSNIILDSFENLDSGDVLIIGDLKIRLTYFCEGCKNLGLEKNILKNIGKDRGILGIILTGGEIKVGDKIVLEKKKFENFPFETKERFLFLQKKLEQNGKFVSYTQTIFLLGLPRGYIRAIKYYKLKYGLENILEKEKIEKLEKSKIFELKDFY